ncbi:hypothetical protein GQ43DRAFT_416177 [Delitschia confertaspora ATCC 74209]|uniref:Hamartin protein-domain-containing protein n=1 Tax=Delitschia confertaspora ATCC 74209 TaxID=1513339 RepID=A0A9P4JN03_9PLEO|nr:hypothetical protein GQ43DRAFT_416177 [Delitschia confertaspora ATCC 74209]
MSAGTMREAVKALTTTFSAPTTPYPLPDELQQTIEAFLERYHDIEEHDSQRFHEDLLSLYTKQVAGHPEKHGSFLGALRLVRPALTGESRLEEWWNLVLKPTIDTVGYKRHVLEDAREIIQSILVFDADEDKDGEQRRLSKHFTKRILDMYLARTKLPSSAGDIVTPEDEFVSEELVSILVAFGRRKPKELLTALDDLFVQKEYRLQALNLMSAFVRLQPPHLHLVLETTLVQHLEKCLMIDSSSTVIELALMVLIMLLPHITSSMTSDYRLCKLFLIYSRILCWDKFEQPQDDESDSVAGDSDTGAQEEGDEDDESEQGWEKAHQALHYTDDSAPALLYYFTFLYGLFPLNFTSFIRKPRKYLKSHDFPGANDFYLDQDLIHTRTEPYRQVHLMHPNMFTTTVEEELSDNRWVKSDPADVVTECMDLCVAVSTTLDDPGPPPTSKLPDLPVSPSQHVGQVENLPPHDEGLAENESATSWRNTQSTMFAPSHNEQPDEVDIESFPKPKSTISSRSPSPVLKKDAMDSPLLPPIGDKFKAESGQTHSVETSPPPQIPSPRLEVFQVLNTASNSPMHTDFRSQNMASLQREIMLLKNDLNFERYLKLQHLTHIGQLQRRHIKEITAEAETQNLINTNRTLKARLAKANELYAQLKREMLTSRNQLKKWESELSAKVRSYRDEQKVWHKEGDDLRADLQKARSDCEKLKKLVEKAEAEGLKAQHRMRALEYELEDYSKMRKELESLQEKVAMFEDQEKEIEGLKKQRKELQNDLHMANMRLDSRDHTREQSMKAYERKMMDLEGRLQAAERAATKPGQLPPSVQQMLDSALAANNAKMQQLKATHYRLLEKYTEMEIRAHELDAQLQAEQGRRTIQDRWNSEPGDDPMNRQYSIRSSSNAAPRDASQTSEEYDYYSEYHSPASAGSPSQPFPGRPVRLQSLPTQSQSLREQQAIANHMNLFPNEYQNPLDDHFRGLNTTEPVASSAKSSFSVDSGGSGSKGDRDKVAPKSEVRIYGRGGAQNIGKKVKDKEDKEKKKQNRSGGFRGLKGIV